MDRLFVRWVVFVFALFAGFLIGISARADRLHFSDQPATFTFAVGNGQLEPRSHTVEQTAADGSVVTTRLNMPATSFTVSQVGHPGPWRFRVRPNHPDVPVAERPWSDYSEWVEWVPALMDCNGDGIVNAIEVGCLRSQYLGRACGTELVFGDCP